MEANKATPSAGKLVLLIGPSGVGKSTILKAIRKTHPEFHYPRSATTRTRRPGEGDEFYHFVTNSEFQDLLNNKKLLEYAIVHGGDHYGTMVDEIIPFIKLGKIVVREVDVQGFVSIQNNPNFLPETKHRLQSIFIMPEHREALVNRIRNRAPISDDELQRRLHSMDKELKYADHCTNVVLNKDGKLEETVKEVENLILNG